MRLTISIAVFAVALILCAPMLLAVSDIWWWIVFDHEWTRIDWNVPERVVGTAVGATVGVAGLFAYDDARALDAAVRRFPVVLELMRKCQGHRDWMMSGMLKHVPAIVAEYRLILAKERG